MCKNGLSAIGGRPVVKSEDVDGFKFYVNEDEWIMVRASGTEPVLRIYAQAPSIDKCRSLLDAAKSTLIG
jgi:phosphomannomutase